MNSEDGARLRRIRGARAAHKAIRDSGRVPGQEARAKVAENRALRERRGASRGRCTGTDSNKGQTNLYGI